MNHINNPSNTVHSRNNPQIWLQKDDSIFLSTLRSLAISVIVFGHVGGFWFYPPWSEFLHVFVPIFFFISGAVSYNSYLKTKNTLQYLITRLTGLLIPYYCFCIFALFFYILYNLSYPEFNPDIVFKFLTLNPIEKITPFSTGHIWFLHTLLIISLASPLIFDTYRYKFYIFFSIILLLILLSSLQLPFNIGKKFYIFGINFYKPLIHSLFFSLGFAIFDNEKLRSSSFSIFAVIFFIFSSIILVLFVKVNPDYAFHTYFPDFYYLCGSFAAIWIFIYSKKIIVTLYIKSPKFIKAINSFLFNHTFAIFLYHTFFIFTTELLFLHFKYIDKSIKYGLIKLILVFSLTAAFAPIFTKIHNSVIRSILNKIYNSKLLKF